MRRLIDETNQGDPAARRAVQLLQSRRPIEVSSAQIARVRAAIDQPRSGPGWGALLLPSVAIAAAVLTWALLNHSHERPLSLPTSFPPSATQPVVTQMPSSVPLPDEPSSRLRPHKKSAPARNTMAAEDRRTESELLVAATEQLRREHAADRAAALLDEDLRRFPNGTLVEEAYALALEAVNGDRAAALAREYLARFPSGRFRAAAERAADARRE